MAAVRFLPLTPPGQTPPRVLAIAGSDSGGAAGLQADLRTFALLGVHGLTALTAVTAQNSLGVNGVHEVPADLVAAQIEAVATDIGVQAAKTGMLASAEIIAAVAERWRGLGLAATAPLVVDPVCASARGEALLDRRALAALRAELFPLASVVTPNLDEVRLLVGIEVVDAASQRDAAKALRDLGPRWALVKGGHLRGAPDSVDLLYDGAEFHAFAAPRVGTRHDHGAGDTVAAAIACALARGLAMPEAASFAKSWVTACLLAAYPLGGGRGPASALFRLTG